MRNPNRNFADLESYIQLYTYNLVPDVVNTLKKVKTKTILFEGFRFTEPIPTSKTSQFLGGELDFRGKMYRIYFDMVANDLLLFNDGVKEYYVSINKNELFKPIVPTVFTHTLKLHTMVEYSGLTQNQVGMLESDWLEISNI